MSDNSSIHPVILCGGSGTRLWPVSLRAKPKPFLPLIGETTLFEQAVARASGEDSFASPIIVAGEAHSALIETQMRGREHRLIVEPMGKNTAPAIALAAAMLPPEAIMLVCPSDHHIADEAAFRAAAKAGAALAADDYMVSFGIAPDRPETGYGYIRKGDPLPGGFAVAQFVEKPDLERAKSYLESGEYSWNGGIFVLRAGAFLAELETHRPAMAKAVREAVAAGQEEGMRFDPDAEIFGAIEGDSIDYAVMENTARAAMVLVDMGWSDIGNWAALHEALQEAGEPSGNVVKGEADLTDCTNVLVSSDGPRVSAVGLEGVCIVVVNGEVLVTTHEGAQQVGKLPGAANQ